MCRAVPFRSSPVFMEEAMTQRAGHIFISHSHEDKELVKNLQNSLELQGLETWVDYQLRAGDRGSWNATPCGRPVCSRSGPKSCPNGAIPGVGHQLWI
jgi:hypothetical protein